MDEVELPFDEDAPAPEGDGEFIDDAEQDDVEGVPA